MNPTAAPPQGEEMETWPGEHPGAGTGPEHCPAEVTQGIYSELVCQVVHEKTLFSGDTLSTGLGTGMTKMHFEPAHLLTWGAQGITATPVVV